VGVAASAGLEARPDTMISKEIAKSVGFMDIAILTLDKRLV
jgi:hypothetical protein